MGRANCFMVRANCSMGRAKMLYVQEQRFENKAYFEHLSANDFS